MRFVFVDDLDLEQHAEKVSEAVTSPAPEYNREQVLAALSESHSPSSRDSSPSTPHATPQTPAATSATPLMEVQRIPDLPEKDKVHPSPLQKVPFLDRERLTAALVADQPSLITMSVSRSAPQLHFLSAGKNGPVQRVQLDPNDATKILRISTYANPQHFLTIALPLLVKQWSILQIHPFATTSQKA